VETHSTPQACLVINNDSTNIRHSVSCSSSTDKIPSICFIVFVLDNDRRFVAVVKKSDV
jgi:hypothetical protein